MMEGLGVLKTTVENKAPERKRVVDNLNRSYGTGKRKSSIARVWVKPGSGNVIINGKDIQSYFLSQRFQMITRQPFLVSNRVSQYDVWCTVSGGGLSGQAGAIRHGISKALAFQEPELVPSLRVATFLTRDVRRVERKKYGRPKARKRFQFSKR
jgi:small subunit ribosomal protein S9